MNEDSGVQESGKDVGYLNLTFLHGKVKAEVTAVSDSIQKAVQLAERVSHEWLRCSNGKDDIAEIAQVGPVVITEKAAVAEDQEAAPVGVAADGNPQAIVAIRRLTEAMPTEDLRAIADVVMDELARRRGPQDGDAEPADLNEIHGGITGGEAAPGAAALGDSVTDN